MINDNGEPAFCLSDVCQVLALSNPAKVKTRLGKGVTSSYTLQTPGGPQLVTFINEDGLYDVILDSRKPEAKLFRKWVTSDVLPSIRKTGGHIYSTETDTPETILDKYKRKKTLLDLKDFVSFKEFNNILNKWIKHIAPGLFFYMVRHTWATFARNKCDVSKDDVAMSLNHIDQALKTTDTYIDPDWSIIDRANRKVLDYVASIE